MHKKAGADMLSNSHKMKEIRDCNVYKLLDWLYDRRSQWLTVGTFPFSENNVIQDDLDWLVEHGLLLSKEFVEPDGRLVKKYRISPGGMIERASHKENFWIRVIPIVISLCALTISVLHQFFF